MTIAGVFTSVGAFLIGTGWHASGGKHDEHVLLGARLAISRIGASLSQQKAASCLGASFVNYLLFERGKKAIPAVALVRMQKEFGIDASWVLLGSEMAGSPADRSALQIFVSDLDRYIGSRQVTIAPERREAIISRWHRARLHGTDVDPHDILCWLEILAD